MSNAVGYLHRIAFILLLIQGSKSAVAQQNWFLYIQSESSQAFYVRIGETIYSSSPVGHLVINGLHDSTYRLAIGFPQSQYREHQFAIPVKKKDHGFELKRSDARSWVLYEWQTQETIKSPRSDSLLYGERKKDDGFASLMAAVVNDSAVLYASVVKAEPVKKPLIDSALAIKKDSVKPETVVVEKKQPDSAKTETALDNTIKPETPANKIPDSAIAKVDRKPDSTVKNASLQPDSADIALDKKPLNDQKTPAVSKFYEQNMNNEKKLVFLDNTIGIKKDTITVIIPLENDSVITDAKTPKEEVTKLQSDTAEKKPVIKEELAETAKSNSSQPLMDSIAILKAADTTRAEIKKVDSAVINQVAKGEMKKVDTAVTNQGVKAEMKKIDSSVIVQPAKEPEPEKPTGLVLVNSDCAKFAKETDVDKLRIKMMKEKEAGNRIFIAHKAFKDMCFATKDIKALSELFPGDELKFRFFETAWPFVSDTALFKTLEETLTDPFFVTRFRTLLKR